MAKRKPKPGALPDLTPQQHQVITLLLEGKKQGQAAAIVGIAPETISRWKQNPHFLAALNGAKLAGYEAAEAGLRALADRALATLAELLEDTENTPPAVRLATAKAVLGFVLGQGRPTGATDPAAIEREKMFERLAV